MNDALDRSLPDPDRPPSMPESTSSEEASSDPGVSNENRTALASETDVDPAKAPEYDLSHLPEAYRDAFRRLHRQVERAADTIDRLRAENERLREKNQELEARPVLPDDKAVLTLDDDPEALRSRISEFIDAIDDYLEATDPEDTTEEDAHSEVAE
ncbi:MAG: cell division protein ZapB [Salinivenus sp.]